jgi:hypothetical protein
MSAEDVGAGEAVGVPEACPGGPGSELAGKAAVSERQSIAERCVNRFLACFTSPTSSRQWARGERRSLRGWWVRTWQLRSIKDIVIGQGF